MTQDTHRGLYRNYFGQDIDDLFIADNEWSRQFQCTPAATDLPDYACPPGVANNPADTPPDGRRPGQRSPARRRMICRIRGSYGGMVTFIIVLILVGLVAGAVARLVVPGRDPIGILGTIVLGIVGSFVGGFVWNLIQYHRLAPHKFHLVGIIGSILGAILVLIVLRMTGMERGRRRAYR